MFGVWKFYVGSCWVVLFFWGLFSGKQTGPLEKKGHEILTLLASELSKTDNAVSTYDIVWFQDTMHVFVYFFVTNSSSRAGLVKSRSHFLWVWDLLLTSGVYNADSILRVAWSKGRVSNHATFVAWCVVWCFLISSRQKMVWNVMA